MSINLGTAIAHLDLDSKGFRNELKKVQSLMQTLRDDSVGLGTKIDAVGQMFVDTGSKLTLGLTAPLAGAGAAAVKYAAKFETSMSQVQATMGITKEATTELNGSVVNTMGALSDLAQRMGAETKFSATEAAAAINNMAMAGYNVQEIFTGLPKVMSLAAAGSLDLDYATQLAANGLNVMGMSVESLDEISDKLAVTASNAYGSVSDFGEGLLIAGGQAKLANLSLTDVFTALGILGDNGIAAAEGGTMLRNVLKNIYTPTERAAKILQQLGVETATSDGELRDFREVLTDLNSVLSSLSEEDRIKAMAEIFDVRTIAGANALLNTSVERWNELRGAIDNSAGAAKRMADTQLDNLSGQLTLVKSGIEGAAIAFGNVMLPVIRRFVEWLQDLTAKLNSLSGAQKEQLIRIAAVVAAIGPVLMILGSLIKSIQTVQMLLAALGPAAGPVGIAIAGLAALAAIIMSVVESSKLVTKEAQKMRESINESVDGFEEANKEYAVTVAAIFATKMTVNEYIKTLEDLEKEYGAAAGQQLKYKAAVESIKALLPDLNVKLDAQTGLIAGGTQALRDQIAAWEDLAIQQAKQQLLQDKMSNYVELIKKAAEATIERKRAEQEVVKVELDRDIAGKKLVNTYNKLYDTNLSLSEVYREMMFYTPDVNSELLSQYRNYVTLSHEVVSATQAVSDWITVEDEARVAVERGKNEVQEYQEGIDEYANYLNDAVGAQNNMTNAVDETSEAVNSGVSSIVTLEDVLANHGKTLDDLASKYEDLEAQVHNAFEVIKQDSSVSYEEMKKNLEENLQIVQNWSSEVQLAFERAGKLGIDEGFVQYLVDLGPQGAKYLHEFLEQSDSEWIDIAEIWRKGASGAYDAAVNALSVAPDEFEQIGKNTGEGFVRGLKSVDVVEPTVGVMGEIIDNAKDALDIHSPSGVFESIGEDTLQGFFNGAEAKAPSVLELMGGIYSQIIGKFDGGGIDMASKGRSIMDGLWSGLRETWNSISSWLSGVASSISGVFSGVVSKSASAFTKGASVGLKGSKMRYASGLDYVPRTMEVVVHEGERILTKAENKQYGTNSGVSVYVNANVSNDYDVERLGVKLGESIRNQIRGTGGDLAWN